MDPSHSISKVRNARLNRSFSNDVLPGLHTLSPLDPKSEEFLELFRSFLSKDERATILALSREDARVFIEIIDRALREARLDIELEKIAFSVLKELCGEIGHLPDSYLLSCRLEPAVIALAPGRFSHIQKGSFEGKDVAVKSLRILKFDGEIQVRKHFCEEITVWRNLSHPNVLNLIGVSDTIEEGRLSVVYEWMANGNIMEYVRTNAGNHLKLLEDAVEGLKYLHQTGIVHGNLKGANILITNTEPISACLADFGFMTIVLNQIVGTRVAKPEVDEWTTPFVAPERLLLSEFVLENGAPTMEGDIYAMAMTTYQVLTGTLPFGEQTGPEVVAQVLEGARPSKPMNALDLGLSDVVWKLLEDCWQKEPHLRPPVEDFLSRVKSAASVCGTLSPVGGFPQRNEDPDSDLMKFDQLFLGMTHDESEGIGSHSIARLPSHDSDTSASNSLFSETSEVSKTESTFTEPLPAFLFNPAPDHAPPPQDLANPISRLSTPISVTHTLPRPFSDNTGPYQDDTFAASSGSVRTLFPDAAPHQRDQPRSEIAAELMPTPYPVLPAAITATMTRARAKSTLQRSRATTLLPSRGSKSPLQRSRVISLLTLRGSESPTIELHASPQLDGNVKNNDQHSRFSVWQRFGRVFMDTQK